jgi:hypothetical protein
MQRWTRATVALLALGLAVNGTLTCCLDSSPSEAACCPDPDRSPAAPSLRGALEACCTAPQEPARTALLVPQDPSHPTLFAAALPAAPCGATERSEPAPAPAQIRTPHRHPILRI